MTIYAGIAHLDALSTQLGFFTQLFAGAVTGFLMGDLQMGLTVGATLQIMQLGIATYGGASVPDFLSGAIIGTVVGIATGNVELGLAAGTAVGLLLMQFDVFARMINLFFKHMADAAAENGDPNGVDRANILGSISWALSRAIPVFIGLLLLSGSPELGNIDQIIPKFIMDGLRFAGGLLPAMGIAILMRYLPLKKFFPFYILGFVIMAYASSLFTIFGVSLIGLALAAIFMMLNKKSGDSKYDDDDMEVEVDG
jgi:PTS system mannose-specific IIC component